MSTRLRIASFNVLTDSYTEYGDYRHTPADLMPRHARMGLLASFIARLDADITGLQEVEQPLMKELVATGRWQTFWSQKENAPDGCLTLVRKNILVDSSETLRFSDGSGHVAQIIKIGGVAIGNTHIKWELPNRTAQVRELLAKVATEPHIVLIGDFNDRPGEPARELISRAGFANLAGDMPTAYIANREGPASIDLFAVRGLDAELCPVQLGEDFAISKIPSRRCPSDHIPIVGQINCPK